MKIPGILIETDLIADFLLQDSESSLMRVALQKYVCYTSFIQTSEILAVSTDENYTRLAMSVLSLLRPLGAHPRYSNTIAELLSKTSALEGEMRWRTAICGSISRVAKLPVLTVRYESVYSRLDIPTIKPDSLRY